MVMTVCAIIGLVIFFWIIYPNFIQEPEMFNGEPIPNNGLPETVTSNTGNENIGEAGNLDQKPPHVDPKTGIIMDGPGFEKGEIEGAYVEGATDVPSNYYFLDDGAGGE
jgi:hypothetical protein